MNISEAELVSSGTRLLARDENAIKRLSELMLGFELISFAGVPMESMLTWRVWALSQRGWRFVNNNKSEERVIFV